MEEEVHGRWGQAGKDPDNAASGSLRVGRAHIVLTRHELLPIDEATPVVVLGESMEHGLITLVDVSVIEKRATSNHGAGARTVIANRLLRGPAQ